MTAVCGSIPESRISGKLRQSDMPTSMPNSVSTPVVCVRTCSKQGALAYPRPFEALKEKSSIRWSNGRRGSSKPTVSVTAGCLDVNASCSYFHASAAGLQLSLRETRAGNDVEIATSCIHLINTFQSSQSWTGELIARSGPCLSAMIHEC